VIADPQIGPRDPQIVTVQIRPARILSRGTSLGRQWTVCAYRSGQTATDRTAVVCPAE